MHSDAKKAANGNEKEGSRVNRPLRTCRRIVDLPTQNKTLGSDIHAVSKIRGGGWWSARGYGTWCARIRTERVVREPYPTAGYPMIH